MDRVQIQIKPLGGIAGDMFAGACASLWPALVDDCLTDLRAAGLPEAVETRFEPVHVNGFAAQKFHVGDDGGMIVATGVYGQIVQRLTDSALDREVLAVALGILRVLGEAEAAVHDRPLDHVHFHELADWDSVADVVAAASFIARGPAADWSVGPLPLGGGTVRTQHGTITVPAPAVLKLLAGFDWHDDGIGGERVTPTGAAIVRFLCQPGRQTGGILSGAGFGAGTKRFEALANVVQLVAFQAAAAPETQPITELAFDIDDMTGEEMAIAADRLRATKGVLDLTQTQQIGKKGRAITLFRLLCRPEDAMTVTQACLTQTSTLGVRRADLIRTVVDRRLTGDAPRVKVAERPDGASAKAESDDIAGHATLNGRRAAARHAETRALEAEDG